MSAAASAETLLFLEDFESYGVLDPATGNPAFDAVWTYSGPGGANSGRTFASGGGGSAMQSIGWITIVDGSAITTSVSLADLAGTDADDGSGNILPDATFRLQFVVSAETSGVARSITGSFEVVPSAGTVTFVSGGNGDGSQALTAFTDPYTANGGSVGKTPERSFTIEFTTSGMTTADAMDLSFGLVSNDAFYFVDDIALVVNPDEVLTPAVAADPATVLSAFSAMIGGEVTDEGNETPNVKLYWGLTDGGTDPLAWDAELDLGLQGGVFSRTLNGLDPGTKYFFRIFGENSAGGAWSALAESFTTRALSGITTTLASEDFAWKYEMDENPSGQDLDGAGSAADWFAGTAGGATIPQQYEGGIAFSNQSPGSAPVLQDVAVSVSGDDAVINWTLSEDGAVVVCGSDNLVEFFPLGTVESGTTSFTDAGVVPLFPEYYYRLDPVPGTVTPEVLFRSDFGGSIQRQSLLGGSFTIELAAKVVGAKEVEDVGIFGVALDPGGASSSFRLNVDTLEVSQNDDAADLLATGDNGDAMHVFRIAYSLNDDRYWAWRDGVLIYGVDLMTGVVGTNGGFNDSGAFFLGDFTGSLSGEWAVDYIRLHDDAVAP